jgi:hypothetical protein
VEINTAAFFTNPTNFRRIQHRKISVKNLKKHLTNGKRSAIIAYENKAGTICDSPFDLVLPMPKRSIASKLF